MTRVFAVPLVLLLGAAALAAPVPKAVKKPVESLDGVWKIETEERDGQASPRASSDYNVWRVTGGQLVLVSAQRDEYTAALTSEELDGGLRSFEYTGAANGYHRRGVYQLDGDTLQIAFSLDPKTRPVKMTSENKGFVYTFKRVQPEK